MIYTKKVTRLRVRISKSTIKSILIVFPFGLRQTHLFGSFFFQAEDGIRDCLLSRGLGDVYKRQESYLITIKKVTRPRVKISKSKIKLIFMVFPSGLRQTRSFLDLFYFNIVHYHKWCHLNLSLIHI